MMMKRAIAGAAVAVALATAAPAQADDAGYLDNLYGSGFYGPAQHWLAVGYGVCAMTAGGANVGQETDMVYRNTGDTVDWAASGRVVMLANVFLC